MQIVKHTDEYANIHPIMNDIESLFAMTSYKSTSKSLVKPVFDDSFDDLINLMNVCGNLDIDVTTTHKDIIPLDLPQFDNKNLIVCFSGGKDSFSVIRHYQKLGYNVYLYHLRGVNKTYYDEWKVAQKMADILGLPIFIDDVKYSGNHMWFEHPMKNMIILNMALTYGITHNITTNIAVGAFSTASVSENPFDVCGGDCVEMFNAYETIIKRIIPKFKVRIPNRNYQTALNALKKEPEYLKYTISCMTPNRFRQLFRDRTINKYHIDLMDNRCGCCWKCATEYIWFTDANILEFNQDYYIHCLEVLRNAFKNENGYNLFSIQSLWSHYFFYPIKKSKIYNILDTIKIYGDRFYYITDDGMERI